MNWTKLYRGRQQQRSSSDLPDQVWATAEVPYGIIGCRLRVTEYALKYTITDHHPLPVVLGLQIRSHAIICGNLVI